MKCTCGKPATERVCVGHIRRGSTFHRYWTSMCERCALDAWREREIARAS